jgi:hypothetical protein
LANDRSGRTRGVQCKLHIHFKLNRHGLAKASIPAPGIWPNSLERNNIFPEPIEVKPASNPLWCLQLTATFVIGARIN